MKKIEYISLEEINEIYAKEFPESMTWKEAFEKMDTIENYPYFQELCSIYCDKLVSILTDNYIKYDFDVTTTEPCRWLMKCVEKLDKNYNFLWAFYWLALAIERERVFQQENEQAKEKTTCYAGVSKAALALSKKPPLL